MPRRAATPLLLPVTGRVGRRRQFVLPKPFCDTVGLHEGDLVEARVEGNKITLTPKSAVDAHLAEALDDLRHGRAYGPFPTHKEFVSSLRANARKLTPTRPKRAPR